MKIHILDDWYGDLAGLPAMDMLKDHDVTIWSDKPESEDILAERLRDAEVVVLFRDRTQVTESLAAKLPNTKLIAMRGNYPNVDVDGLTKHGILFCSDMSSGGANVSTAELAFLLGLSTLRYLPEAIGSARAGKWQGDAPLGRRASGRIFGLYGYGKIAKVVAGYARAFGMQVLVWGSDAGRERARADGIETADSREAFFGRCDVVSLHVRLTKETRGTITRADLMAMREDAILVNTSRAALIEPGALLETLNAGRPGRAALDVFDAEPVTNAADPLLSHPRVIPTPHVGFITEEELDGQFSTIFRTVLAYGAGEPDSAINPEVLS
ncbi:D-2-hydroxyacid dehydrogenase family protein [Roseicyclus sp. F158]|uniref:D-2-hydroxyacid dehydrogenase family protein n=1 Tax=Tropicimonas omnivorans TaxID=3075590 RepID=A0ABU3DCL1_9RHOB|nr:D-2-hydroxyacid dehydrogenase family protein [Roseicyclus sp. F158]MDT0681446.1 D-2-hydroxyacid dehydrogenase family protein [Roseicyclus sp. F158]